MRTSLLGAAACIPLSLPAMADSLGPAPADPVVLAPAPDPSRDWSGFRAGLALGFHDADVAWFFDGQGEFAGVRLGYDLDLGRLVLGGRFDYDFTSLDLGPVTNVEDVWRVGARAGYDAGRTLPYVTAGYGGGETHNAGTGKGAFYGAGVEVFVTDRLTAGFEVLHQDFDDFTIDGLEAETVGASLSLNLRF
jgi:opacity protein-like surface antigen